MARCEACGSQCLAGAAFCAACGHRLGQSPAEPVVVTVRVVESLWSSFWSCWTTAIAIVVLIMLVLWLLSC
jgi:uncharacterized membrane protein YvbJ